MNHLSFFYIQIKTKNTASYDFSFEGVLRNFFKRVLWHQKVRLWTALGHGLSFCTYSIATGKLKFKKSFSCMNTVWMKTFTVTLHYLSPCIYFPQTVILFNTELSQKLANICDGSQISKFIRNIDMNLKTLFRYLATLHFKVTMHVSQWSCKQLILWLISEIVKGKTNI